MNLLPSRLRVLLLLLAVLIGSLTAAPARAEWIEVTSASLQPDPDSEGAWVLSSDSVIGLTPKVEEAVTRGVTLYFVLEFQMTLPRWYWFDDRTATATQTWRLSYHALTRQYRLSQEGLQLRFNTLQEALRTLTHTRSWRVLEKDAVKLGETYQAQVRLRLDTTLLPKPFQVTAITNRDWTLASEWKRFSFTPRLAEKTPEPK